jgi:hypothetical protein
VAVPFTSRSVAEAPPSRRRYCTFPWRVYDSKVFLTIHVAESFLAAIDHYLKMIPQTQNAVWKRGVAAQADVCRSQLFSGWHYVVETPASLDLRYSSDVYRMLILLEGAHRAVLQMDWGSTLVSGDVSISCSRHLSDSVRRYICIVWCF